MKKAGVGDVAEQPAHVKPAANLARPQSERGIGHRANLRQRIKLVGERRL